MGFLAVNVNWGCKYEIFLRRDAFANEYRKLAPQEHPPS